jgi:hypothetical protein
MKNVGANFFLWCQSQRIMPLPGVPKISLNGYPRNKAVQETAEDVSTRPCSNQIASLVKIAAKLTKDMLGILYSSHWVN